MFKLKIDTGNAEMRTPDHVAEALREVAQALDGNTRYQDDGFVRDVNGNTVGRWSYQLDMTEDEDE